MYIREFTRWKNECRTQISLFQFIETNTLPASSWHSRALNLRSWCFPATVLGMLWQWIGLSSDYCPCCVGLSYCWILTLEVVSVRCWPQAMSDSDVEIVLRLCWSRSMLAQFQSSVVPCPTLISNISIVAVNACTLPQGHVFDVVVLVFNNFC